MIQIPDHPAIARAERTGYPGGYTEPILRCKVCGEELDADDRVYSDEDGVIVGCEYCLEVRSAWDQYINESTN